MRLGRPQASLVCIRVEHALVYVDSGHLSGSGMSDSITWTLFYYGRRLIHRFLWISQIRNLERTTTPFELMLTVSLYAISTETACAVSDLSQTCCDWIFQYRFQPILLRSWLDLGPSECKLSGIADCVIHTGVFYLDSRIFK